MAKSRRKMRKRVKIMLKLLSIWFSPLVNTFWNEFKAQTHSLPSFVICFVSSPFLFFATLDIWNFPAKPFKHPLPTRNESEKKSIKSMKNVFIRFISTLPILSFPFVECWRSIWSLEYVSLFFLHLIQRISSRGMSWNSQRNGEEGAAKKGNENVYEIREWNCINTKPFGSFVGSWDNRPWHHFYCFLTLYGELFFCKLCGLNEIN